MARELVWHTKQGIFSHLHAARVLSMPCRRPVRDANVRAWRGLGAGTTSEGVAWGNGRQVRGFCCTELGWQVRYVQPLLCTSTACEISRASARLKKCPTACQPQPAAHACPPSPSLRCCAPSTPGCRLACMLCPWHALRRGCRRGGRATLSWLGHGPARVSMGWGYASAPTLRC